MLILGIWKLPNLTLKINQKKWSMTKFKHLSIAKANMLIFTNLSKASTGIKSINGLQSRDSEQINCIGMVT